MAKESSLKETNYKLDHEKYDFKTKHSKKKSGKQGHQSNFFELMMH